MKYLLLLVVVVSFLSACTSFETKEREFDPALCEEAISYQAGFNDGREGRNMNSSYAFQCREDLRPGSLRGYKDGYNKGLVEYKHMEAERQKRFAEMQRAEEARRQREDQGRGGVVLPGPSIIIGGGSYNPRAWYCKLEVFTETFEGFGSTRLEAFQALKRSCVSKRGNDFFCKERDARCEENR